jgi:hypothetical protein
MSSSIFLTLEGYVDFKKARNVLRSPPSKARNHPVSARPAGVSGMLGATAAGGVAPVASPKTRTRHSHLDDLE